MAINGIGRPSKGHRIRVTTRVDPLVHLAVARAADKAGLTVSEWAEIVIRERVAPMMARDDLRYRIEART